MAHISEQKKHVVDEFVKLINDYPIIGAVNMEGLPTPQLQNMRAQLRESMVLKMSKRRLMKICLEKAGKKGVEKLIPFLKGHPALLFTKENPFKLFKNLEKNKSTAPAKAGQTAPKDIVVPAGSTDFAPGPIIGELGAIGIKAGIDGGKVAIKEDAVVVKEGEEINQNVAAILLRLKIEPMEIGLDLTATYEDGEIFTKDVLRIDEKEYLDNLTKAHQWSFNLAVEAGVYNNDTIVYMVAKAHSNAKGLALSHDILADEIVGSILAKAEGQMLALKANVPEALTEEKPKEEKPKEAQSSEAASGEAEPSEPEETAEEAPKTEETTETPAEEPAKEEAPVEEKPQEEEKVEEEAKEEAPEAEVKEETPETPSEEAKPEESEEKEAEPKKEEKPEAKEEAQSSETASAEAEPSEKKEE